MDVIVEEGKDGPPDEYVVEAVINKRIFDGKLHYLIKWQGWPIEESTWEPVENCTKCENLIQEYETELKREADASARQMKTDESSSSSGPEIISDYEAKRRSRKRKTKNRQCQRKKSKSNNNDDDSDFGKRGKTKKRKLKKFNHKSFNRDYLSTDYLDGESTTTLDSDSSSSKSNKGQKDSVDNFSKKNRATKEDEAIKQILGINGSAGASRVRSREESSTCTITSETVIQQLPNDIKPPISPHHESLELEMDSNIKPRRRISSSSSSETENYERKYFGWERGKKIAEVIDWYGYKDKVLHLVKYHDSEYEYVDDTYTCKVYPLLVFEMYNKQTSGQLDENQRVWLSYAIQRFQEIEKNGPYDEETLSMDESNEELDNDSGQEETTGGSELDNDSGQEEIIGDSELVVNTMDDESLDQNDSVFIVNSDSSFDEITPINPHIIDPEFVIENSSD